MPNCYYCGAADATIRGVWGDDCCASCFAEHFSHCVNCGAVCYQGNSLCEECYDRNRRWAATEMTGPSTTKRTKTNRCFGIELETDQCDNYQALKGKTIFGAKEDGSIDGMEFVSPILWGDRGLAEIRKFCRLAKQFEVSRDCGYHLHIDMRDTTTQQRRAIAFAYSLTLEAWKHLVAKHRWGNTYCADPDYTADDILNVFDFDRLCRNQCRYAFINIAAYDSHKTFEIRGYQGTLNATEICNWIKAHLLFVEYVKDRSFVAIELFAKHPVRMLRWIFGPTLSRYYSKQWRQNAVCH